MSPKRFANATCSSSARCCPGNTRTAWSWNACSTIFQAAPSILARLSSVTTAPSVASIGVLLGSMESLLLGSVVDERGVVEVDRRKLVLLGPVVLRVRPLRLGAPSRQE